MTQTMYGEPKAPMQYASFFQSKRHSMFSFNKVTKNNEQNVGSYGNYYKPYIVCIKKGNFFFFFAILPLQGKSNGLFFPHFLTMRKNHSQFFLLVFNSENFEKQKIHDIKGNIIFI